MTKAIIGIVTVVIIGCIGLPMLLISAVLGGSGGCAPAVPNASGQPGIGRWDSEQVSIAATIVEVGATKGIPRWGRIVALATAMQESQLRNLPYLGENNDHDSIGVFQQRPSQGWGTPEQLTDPAYQAGRFYDKLLTVLGWQEMPLTQAAQAVQVSAYPSAYAKWTGDAILLADAVVSASGRAIPEDLEQCVSTCPTGLDSGRSSGPAGACPGGQAVLARAATWLTAWNGRPVPYLSSGDPRTWLGGYRRDCSGYASMALGLPEPGLTSRDFAARARPIPKSALSAGDLLVNPAPDLAGHVVIFDHWVDDTMTSYLGYEQSGDGGTHHRVIPYPYFGGYQMSPYRWVPAG
jgi:hypothetical protein